MAACLLLIVRGSHYLQTGASTNVLPDGIASSAAPQCNPLLGQVAAANLCYLALVLGLSTGSLARWRIPIEISSAEGGNPNFQ